MLKQVRIIAAIAGLALLSTAALAQLSPTGPTTPPAPSQVGYCCASFVPNSGSPNFNPGYGDSCTPFVLSANGVNSCATGFVFSCGAGSFIQCVPEGGMLKTPLQACACETFSFPN